MWFRVRNVLATALLLSASLTKASAGRVTGVIASVTQQATLSIQVTSSETGTREIRTDNHTSYMRWITHQPWQREIRANSQSLVVGRCVDVELRAADPGVAKVVRVSDEPSGTLFDPCKSSR
jgi:hypothetical protein